MATLTAGATFARRVWNRTFARNVESTLTAPLVTASFAAKVIGPLLLAKHFAAKLPPDGSFLFMSGATALKPAPGMLAVAATNAAVDTVTAGLAVELGRRYAEALPPALVAAAEARGVPLIELRREVAFIEITEAVHARIIDELLVSRAAATLALGQLLTSQAEIPPPPKPS